MCKAIVVKADPPFLHDQACFAIFFSSKGPPFLLFVLNIQYKP